MARAMAMATKRAMVMATTWAMAYGKEGGGHSMAATMAMGMRRAQRTRQNNQNTREYVGEHGMYMYNVWREQGM